MTFNEDGSILAEARLEVKELESLAGRLLEDDDRDEIDTLGGLVCAVAGRVPGGAKSCGTLRTAVRGDRG